MIIKIKIELDERCQQREVIIRCAQLNEEVVRMQEEISFFKRIRSIL